MNPEEYSDRANDRALLRLEAQLKGVYTEAVDGLNVRILQYVSGYDEDGVHHAGMFERREEQLALFEAGEWRDASGIVCTDRDVFDRWWAAQEARRDHWINLRDEMAERLTAANETAAEYINEQLPAAYARASNGVAGVAQATAAEQKINISFELVDEPTVRSLVTNNREVFPFHLVHIDPNVDTPWNKKKLQNCLLQGILQGDSIGRIANRFQSVESMNRVSAIRNARTAMTAARNGGKQDRMTALQEQGCEITKVWNAAHDGRTREAHQYADKQEVPIDEPFKVGGQELMHPGDTSMGASGWNIYNCRCSMKSGKIKFKSLRKNTTQANHDSVVQQAEAPKPYTSKFVRLKTAEMPYGEYVSAKYMWQNHEALDLPAAEREHVFEELDNNLTIEERETSLVHRAIGNYFYTAINMGHNTYKIIEKKPIDIEHSLNEDEALIDEVMRDVIGDDWRKYEEN